MLESMSDLINNDHLRQAMKMRLNIFTATLPPKFESRSIISMERVATEKMKIKMINLKADTIFLTFKESSHLNFDITTDNYLIHDEVPDVFVGQYAHHQNFLNMHEFD